MKTALLGFLPVVFPDFKLYEWSWTVTIKVYPRDYSVIQEETVTTKVYPREYSVIQEQTRALQSGSYSSVKLVCSFSFYFNFRTESSAFKI